MISLLGLSFAIIGSVVICGHLPRQNDHIETSEEIKSTSEQRQLIGIEFINYVDAMHNGLFVWPKNKEFAEYCKYLFAKYQTHMDLLEQSK